MQERATGLIFRTYPLTETSLIIHWLTEDLGRLATVAKGALRAKSPLRGKLDLFYLADFSFQRSRRSDLHTLREVKLLEAHTFLRRDLGCLRQAAYGAALIEQTTEVESPIPALYHLMHGLLQALQKLGAQPLILLAFEMKLLAESGLQPDLQQAFLSSGARQILARLAELDWPTLSRLKPSVAQIAEISPFIQGLLFQNWERAPRGRDAALGLDG